MSSRKEGGSGELNPNLSSHPCPKNAPHASSWRWRAIFYCLEGLLDMPGLYKDMFGDILRQPSMEANWEVEKLCRRTDGNKKGES